MSPVKTLTKSLSATATLTSIGGPPSEGGDSGARALAELEQAVNLNARRFNDLKQVADKKADALKLLQVQYDMIFMPRT